MRVAITGGTGSVGQALQQRLRESGHEPVVIRRGEPETPGADWEPYSGWVRPGAFDGIDGVVHLSGVPLPDKRWSPEFQKVLRDSRIVTGRVLAEHLASLDQKPSVLITASAVGYYGHADNRVLTEESPKGNGFLCDLCADWEASIQPAADAGIRTAALRCGPSLEGFLPKMLFPFKMGVGGPIGRGQIYLPWISLHDMSAAYLHVLTSDLSGPVNACAPQQVTNMEFTKAFGRAIRRPTIFPIPPLLLRTLYGPGANEMLLWSHRVEPAKLIASGFEYRHPDIDTALRVALDNIKNNAA